jgi:hypothetical protein
MGMAVFKTALDTLFKKLFVNLIIQILLVE